MAEAPAGVPVVEVTRRYRFSAAHRMHNPRLGAGENARLYGRCNHPSGHGHTYRLSVTLRGPVRPDTGDIEGGDRLDQAVTERILSRLDHANLDDVITRAEGPTSTTEALLLLCWKLLAPALPPRRLWRLRVEETPNNTFELSAGG
jgi:6-pyruvoyltetrahydropterin/6-carboxytetrahydropterin synthase